MSDPKATAPVTLTNEQFQELFSAIRTNSENLTRDVQSSSPAPEKQGNFAKCTAHFDASSDSSVEAFVGAVSTYKSCANVSDENALRGLPMLLTGLAAKWYQGVKNTIDSWDSALTLLKDVYGPKKPAFKIFRKLFAEEQKDTKAELFICNARALLAKLPYTLEENVYLDMVYGLLNKSVRERIPRDDATTFNELFTRIRSVEASFGDLVDRSDADQYSKEIKFRKERPKCTFCRRFGHLVEDCRTKRRQTSKTEGNKLETVSTPTPVTKTTPTYSCYGCGTPGVVRSKKCNEPKSSPADIKSNFSQPSTSQSSFFGITIPQFSQISHRPILPIKIFEEYGLAYADTGATRSIAGQKLYSLVKGNVPICYETLSISLADDTHSIQNVPLLLH
ncbi:hypothetical protein NQ314_011052 [Rhamnusium bicolor]|uniref:CCHC-type domain-containing protein n=1 Tax=Rhamnusium bicolor TaxID=1586634 RepID=A0AAV8XNP3_9CUCU|nr:hypothetical protein NQ314_011052 [Rhamnusium bicolor]